MAVLAIGAAPAAADTLTIFSIRADWNAAVPASTVITFEGTAGISTSYGMRAEFEGVAFTGEEIFTVAPALNYDSPHHTSTYLEWQNPPRLDVTFPGPVHAVAFDYGTFYGEIHNLELELPWNAPIGLRTAAFADRFFGLVSDRPFNGFVLRDVSGNFPTLDNFSFATPAPVPEPGSLLLLGSGLLWSVRRIRNQRRQTC